MTVSHANNDYAARLANQARTPEAFKVANRIYFHHHNHAKFHFDLGGSTVKSVSFANYKYITDDKREQDQLDLVADVPGTFIYTMQGSDIEKAMLVEIQQEVTKDIIRTAVAQSAVSGQVFDPNAPVIPVPTTGVTIQHIQPSAVSVAPLQPQPVAAVVGLQNSMSGTQPTDPISAQMTTAASQTQPPSVAHAAAAKAALDAMSSK